MPLHMCIEVTLVLSSIYSGDHCSWRLVNEGHRSHCIRCAMVRATQTLEREKTNHVVARAVLEKVTCSQPGTAKIIDGRCLHLIDNRWSRLRRQAVCFLITHARIPFLSRSSAVVARTDNLNKSSADYAVVTKDVLPRAFVHIEDDSDSPILYDNCSCTYLKPNVNGQRKCRKP